ncbi:MAG: hypothetical protein AVDCRST_MAG77-6192, partial [uncultured Chloroflexi bacterium]
EQRQQNLPRRDLWPGRHLARTSAWLQRARERDAGAGDSGRRHQQRGARPVRRRYGRREHLRGLPRAAGARAAGRGLHLHVASLSPGDGGSSRRGGGAGNPVREADGGGPRRLRPHARRRRGRRRHPGSGAPAAPAAQVHPRPRAHGRGGDRHAGAAVRHRRRRPADRRHAHCRCIALLCGGRARGVGDGHRGPAPERSAPGARRAQRLRRAGAPLHRPLRTRRGERRHRDAPVRRRPAGHAGARHLRPARVPALHALRHRRRHCGEWRPCRGRRAAAQGAPPGQFGLGGGSGCGGEQWLRARGLSAARLHRARHAASAVGAFCTHDARSVDGGLRVGAAAGARRAAARRGAFAAGRSPGAPGGRPRGARTRTDPGGGESV